MHPTDTAHASPSDLRSQVREVDPIFGSTVVSLPCVATGTGP
jgi:hypothetical protein